MKFHVKLIALAVSTLLVTSVNAQRRTVEERVSAVHEKFVSSFQLDAAKLAKVDSAFATYYRKQDKIREEARQGGERPDFQAMREKMQPAIEARDKELQGLLTAEQYKKWKEEIEPGMAPQRPGRRDQ